MSQHPAFRRAFLIVFLLGSLLVFVLSANDARSAPTKEDLCQLSTSSPTFVRGNVNYTAYAFCLKAEVVRWTLSIYRSGVPWASRSEFIRTQPMVSKRCVRSGLPVTLRPVLKIEAWYSPFLKQTRIIRGNVTSARCAA